MHPGEEAQAEIVQVWDSDYLALLAMVIDIRPEECDEARLAARAL